MKEKDYTTLFVNFHRLCAKRNCSSFMPGLPFEELTMTKFLGILIAYASDTVGGSDVVSWKPGRNLYYICLGSSGPIIMTYTKKPSKFAIYFQTPYLAEKVIKEFECVFRMFWELDNDFLKGVFENKFTYPLTIEGLY